jgi:hypothetical protein
MTFSAPTGELATMGIPIAASSVWAILKRHDIEPAATVGADLGGIPDRSSEGPDRLRLL